MPGGRYLVHARAGTTIYRARELELPDDALVEVELTPGAGGRLEVLALDARDAPLPGEPIRISQLDATAAVSLTLGADSEGRLVVEHLPIGRYRVSLSTVWGRVDPIDRTLDVRTNETSRA